VNVFDFLGRARDKDDTIGLEAFSITAAQFSFWVPCFVD
jgi:hypothetical protein